MSSSNDASFDYVAESAVGTEKLAIVRKVAFAGRTNPRFVADVRLWRWTDAVVEED